MKKIQIGARITAEDAEFLNLLEINGATTPSDKLRAIIEEARLRSTFTHDFTGSYRMIQDQLGPFIEKIKKSEFQNEIHSTILIRILEWLPEYYAFCLSSLAEENGDSIEELKRYEKGAVDRVVRLFESLLHLELSTQVTSYTPGVFSDHLKPLAELMQIINKSSQAEEGEK